MQLDEKWSFVTKKQKHCQPGEDRCGDCWDHVALDAASRLVRMPFPVSGVPAVVPWQSPHPQRDPESSPGAPPSRP